MGTVVALAAVMMNRGGTDERWAVAYDFVESFAEAKWVGSPSTEVRNDRAGGISRSAIFQHPTLDAGAPPARLTYPSVALPSLASGEKLRLRLYIGMSDRIDRAASPAADGCEFVVAIQGRELLRKVWNEQRWFEWTADVTEYAGQTVAVEFRVGARSNSQADWALWGEPRIEIVGRPWKPREGPRAPSLRLSQLNRPEWSADSDRTARAVGTPYGMGLVTVMDPYLDLPVQVQRWSARVGPPEVPLPPTIVAGEGPDPMNHTLVRVLGRYGIAHTQFLAYPPDVRGGVAVAVGRNDAGAVRIVTAPLSDTSVRHLPVYDLDGLPTGTIKPESALKPPFAVCVGNFTTARGDEVAVVAGIQGRLYDLNGKVLARFTVPGTGHTISLSRVPGARTERLMAYRPGASAATVLSFDPTAKQSVRIPAGLKADGVYPSAFRGRWLAGGPHPSASSVTVIQSGKRPATTDVGAYENIFWYQWYRPTTEGKHVRVSDFAHLRTDHATDAGRDPERAADPGAWDADAIRARYGIKGGFAGYLTDRPKLWEPCFTHRQPKGVFEGWLKARDDATGMPLYPMLTRNGRVVEYGEFGNIDFYASTYAFGLPAIDNLYILPLRAFLRQLATPFRQRPEHCAGLEPNHEHEIAVEADGSMGDYNLKMIEGFHGYLRRIYGGSDADRAATLGVRFDEYFDAPRNWDRGDWDRYDPANPFYKAWTDYNRYVVSRRVAETFREALLAGFPPEIIKCHQIPDTYAIGNLQAFSDVTARFTPIDWMLNAGTGYGFTRYGVWYNRPHDALQDAHSSGFDAISIGEYQALTPDPKAAYEQLRFMFENGCVSAHCMLWPQEHDRGYNDTMHAALQRLIAEDPPRPGLTGGVGQIRPYSAGNRRFDVACIGTGSDRTGLLKSLNADGSWEGSVYVVPFHAHVEVTPIASPATATLGADNPLVLGPLDGLDSGEQIEIVGEARSDEPSKAAIEIQVTRAGLALPGLNHRMSVRAAWRPFRYVLRNQLPTEDIRIALSASGGAVHIRGLRVTRQSEQTAKLTKGRFGGVRHRGAVTFDIVRGER
jgi:hypothetical protein